MSAMHSPVMLLPLALATYLLPATSLPLAASLFFAASLPLPPSSFPANFLYLSPPGRAQFSSSFSSRLPLRTQPNYFLLLPLPSPVVALANLSLLNFLPVHPGHPLLLG